MLTREDIQKAIDEKLPLVTRGGEKAYVFTDLNKLDAKTTHGLFCIQGYICGNNISAWTVYGRASYHEKEHVNDLVDFWREKHTATVTIPCPLKEPRKDMWFIGQDMRIVKSLGVKCVNFDGMKRTFYFASVEEAELFRDAINNVRKG